MTRPYDFYLIRFTFVQHLPQQGRLMLHSSQPCRQADEHIVVIGLATLKGGLVADGFAAFVTAVDNDISLLGVGESLYGTKDALTIVGSVTGVYIHV